MAKTAQMLSNQTSGRGSRNRCGFTLIEMLVVLLILGLLAALITPSLSSGRKASLRVNCMNRIRQLCMGIQMYAQDSGGTLPGLLPSCEKAAPPWLRQDHLPDMSIYSIFGPTGNKEFEDSMFVCPGGENPEETDAPAGIWVDGAYEFLVGPSRGWVKMDSIRDGTSWPLCMDPRPGIHSGGTRNIGFLDGHVDMVREENTARLIISAHSDQNLKNDRSIICAYFPEDCIP